MQLETFRAHGRNPESGMRSMRISDPISGLHRGFASGEYGRVLYKIIRRFHNPVEVRDSSRAVISQTEMEGSKIASIILSSVRGLSNIDFPSIACIVIRHDMLHKAS